MYDRVKEQRWLLTVMLGGTMLNTKICSVIVVTGAITLVASSCVASNDTASPESNVVTVGTWGGDMEKFQRDSVVPVVNEEAPDLDVRFAIADGETRLAQIRAQSDGPGTMDVVGLTRDRSELLVQAGLLTKLDMSKIPNAKYIRKPLRNDYCLPHITSTISIIYNEDEVKPAPTSYEVLWDPKYEGRLGFYIKDNWKPLLYAAAAYEKGGNPDDNWMPGWPLLEDLVETMDPVNYTSNETLGQAMMRGQTWITISQQARGVQWDDAGEANLDTVVAEETGFRYISCVGIPKNAPNPDGAYEYLNAVLDPRPQAYFAENMGYAPTVTNADIDPELSDRIDSIEAERDGRVTTENYAYLAKHYSEWTERITRLFG